MNNAANKTRFSLVRIIFDDLFKTQKLALFLMGLIIISAVMVLMVTQATRITLVKREQLLLEKDVLENEWRNLIIEENVLADSKRIEQKAIYQLGMQYVTPENETVIVVKQRLLSNGND